MCRSSGIGQQLQHKISQVCKAYIHCTNIDIHCYIDISTCGLLVINYGNYYLNVVSASALVRPSVCIVGFPLLPSLPTTSQLCPSSCQPSYPHMTSSCQPSNNKSCQPSYQRRYDTGTSIRLSHMQNSTLNSLLHVTN